MTIASVARRHRLLHLPAKFVMQFPMSERHGEKSVVRRGGVPLKITGIFLALSMALFNTGCRQMFVGKKAGEQSITEFHKLYNEERLSDIYSAAHTDFKSATSAKEFQEFIGAMRRKLGKVAESTNVGTFNLKSTVVLNQNTKFEQGSAWKSSPFKCKTTGRCC